MTYSLNKVQTNFEWSEMHRIRKSVLFTGVSYDENHPDDRLKNHHPYLLSYFGNHIGIVRLDCKKCVGIVRLVGIDIPYQRQSHGRVLDEMVQAKAHEFRIKTLYLNAEPNAIGFYQKMGWEAFDWDDRELIGIAADCLQMRKLINVE